MRAFIRVSRLLVAVILLVPRMAAADVRALIEWDAPPSCPGASVLYARLESVLGREPSDLGAFSEIRGVIVERAQRWQLALEMFDGVRRRTRLIDAKHCEDLAEAAAVAIALALDAERGDALEAAAVPERESPQQAPLTVPEPAPDHDHAAVSAAARASRGLEAQLQALLDLSSLPGPAPGVSAEARVRLARTLLGVYAAWLPPKADYVRADRFVDFSLLAAGARACQRVLDTVLTGAACLGLEAGNLHAQGSGLAASRSVDNLWLAPQGALELGAPLWRTFAVELRAEALRPLVRRPYLVNGAEQVHRPPAVATRLYLGVVWAPF